MIAMWMAFAIMLGAIFGLAALAAQRAAAAVRAPTRFIWLAALLAAAIWPVVALLGGAHENPASGAGVLILPLTVGVERASALVAASSTQGIASRVGIVLMAGWGTLTLLLLARLLRAARMLGAQRSAWRPYLLDGVAVRLSSAVGPAVVGLRAMDIVLPEWMLTLDRPLRAMVLRHEEEHRLARDPYLLAVSALLVALVPWNPVVWRCARRLRLAIELDCDARVLRAHPRPERYGLLLLAIAQRHSATVSELAPAHSEPAFNLERRIIAMRPVTTRFIRARLVVCGAVAVAAVAVACSVPAPDKATGPGHTSSLASSHAAVGSPSTAPGTDARLVRAPGTATRGTELHPNQTYFAFQVEQTAMAKPGNPRPRYPSALESARVSGKVLVEFVVDTLGRVDMSMFKVIDSTDPRFADAVTRVIPEWKFDAARVGGRKVKQLVQMPLQFRIAP
ncbi:MAG TPA: M56 family metallopeptidase [Gemmatimonadaceae bacterium]|nr:M56 family metallopeptidase [Gemmatimonadaceae bacterium]